MNSLHAIITGRVQGVAFRAYTQRQADQLGIRGWVRNLPDGSVEALLQGNTEQLAAMTAWLQHGPSLAAVASVRVDEAGAVDLCPDFTIRY